MSLKIPLKCWFVTTCIDSLCFIGFWRAFLTYHIGCPSVCELLTYHDGNIVQNFRSYLCHMGQHSCVWCVWLSAMVFAMRLCRQGGLRSWILLTGKHILVSIHTHLDTKQPDISFLNPLFVMLLCFYFVMGLKEVLCLLFFLFVFHRIIVCF